ncbi:General transcription and dna repair factor iih subunit tfb2 [Thalictrum thalictroides]|uniref:RNA polymerase II transcription factor B subunit 2 n=1 Tax=Thalictrum thalictroides TaxID=46969 RepID=A0A7J6WRN2_THATH|nr:General transcription and dna repair factor iih subunit tfb2 [Thalictrum thalictroides]
MATPTLLFETLSSCFKNIASLPPLANKYVLHVLCIDIAVTAKSMEEWFLPNGGRDAVDTLVQLRVIDRKKGNSYMLNPMSQSNLHKVFSKGWRDVTKGGNANAYKYYGRRA